MPAKRCRIREQFYPQLSIHWVTVARPGRSAHGSCCKIPIALIDLSGGQTDGASLCYRLITSTISASLQCRAVFSFAGTEKNRRVSYSLDANSARQLCHFKEVLA